MTYYFAWVDAIETAFLPEHKREDEDVFAFSLRQDEGGFPTLTIDIRNPKRRLLQGDVWAWLAKDDTPLFFGRLVAVPEDMAREIVSLSFVSRPPDYDTRKRALADTLRVAPYWDEIWLKDERLDDPDVVLEARNQLWHVDRLTHALTVSSITNGEDGTYVFGPDDFFYDSLRIRYGSAPLRRVRVEAEIGWDQKATGTLPITGALADAFRAAGTPSAGLASSYTGQGLESDWPAPSARLDGGWHVAVSTLERADGVWKPSRFIDVPVASLKPASETEGAQSDAFFSTPYSARFYCWEFKMDFQLGYDVSRQYVETIKFDLEADVQRILTEPGDTEVEIITLSSRKVSEPIGANPPAIGDVKRNSYLRTDRGRQSLDYLIALARATLLARARAVEIEISMPFDNGLEFTCRKNAQINDTRILGGTATGKIISYELIATGNGEEIAQLTIGCMAGEGAQVAALPGSPAYADEGYMSTGYQFYTDADIMPFAGEVTYTDFSDISVQDDGLNFLSLNVDDVLIRLEVINGETRQAEVMRTSDAPSGVFADIPSAIEVLNSVHTEVWLELKPLTGGPFETEYNIQLSRLMIPQTVLI